MATTSNPSAGDARVDRDSHGDISLSIKDLTEVKSPAMPGS